MGDKGGKKDKAKSKQQHDLKQKAEAKRNQEKSPARPRSGELCRFITARVGNGQRRSGDSIFGAG